MPRKKPLYLTKSRFMSGLSCPKLLWLGWHQPLPYEEAPAGSPMAMGTEIGIKAHTVFPGGVLVDAKPWEHEKAVQQTKDLMADPLIPAIFEGAFEYEGLRIRADVLERYSDDQWILYEVKGSTSVKMGSHLPDVSVQTYVLEGCGVQVERAGIMHVDNQYVRAEDGVEWNKFFTQSVLNDEIQETLPTLPALIAEQFKVLRKRKEPAIEVGGQCGGCDYWDHCTQDKPDDWVRYLYRVRQPVIQKLKSLGVESIKDIPDDFPLDQKQTVQREAVISGDEWVSDDLEKALKQAGPPAHYLDFETMMPGIPIYKGTRPYQTLAFQWSLHSLDAKQNLSHQEFLADGRDDPRRQFSETLIEALSYDDWPIAVYSSYEMTILKGLAVEFPDLAKNIQDIIARLLDLLPIVRGHIYHPNFNGSFSIKAVGPTLCPDIDYKALDLISDGGGAAGAIAGLANRIFSKDEEKEIRTSLLKYCELDTMALVDVHRELAKRT